MREIELTQGFRAVVDDDDIELLSKYKWRASRVTPRNKVVYARGYLKTDAHRGKTVLMHRIILDATKTQQVDHINRNGLDNRRCNLRFVTGSQNKYNRGPPKNNTSGFKGVVWNPSARKWQAQIGVGYQLKYLGVFMNKSDAVAAYAEAYRSLSL